MKDSIFSEQALQKIKRIRKVFLWTAVWILIGELIMGAILILGQNLDVSIFKIQGTFALFAVALFISVNNFIRIEKGNKVIQGLALVSFIANMAWALFATLLIWEVLPFYFTEETLKRGYYSSYTTTVFHLTFWAKLMFIAVTVAATGFWTSNILAIKETTKPVKPLKFTSVVCEFYCGVFSIIAILVELAIDENTGRWYALAGLASFAFLTTALAAWIISRTSGKDEKVISEREDNNRVDKKTDDELRAEIEEQVRREMIEKEVRARMEAELGKENKED